MYEVAIQMRDLKMTRVIVETSKAAAIQAARQWAKEASADVAWVHVFSLATDLSVVSFQSLT
jgi:hypothetical protein